MNNEENEKTGYKSMWICAPGFVLVFGTVFLALWLVTEAAGI